MKQVFMLDWCATLCRNKEMDSAEKEAAKRQKQNQLKLQETLRDQVVRLRTRLP